MMQMNIERMINADLACDDTGSGDSCRSDHNCSKGNQSGY